MSWSDAALSILTDREQQVLEMRYGLQDRCPLTKEEVGLCLNLTGERIRQLEVKAISKLVHLAYGELANQ
jgi:RNA polymerase primary sigma factor